MFFPVFLFFIFFSLLAGRLIEKTSFSLALTAGFSFIFIHILVFNILNVSVSILIYLLIAEFLILFVYYVKKGKTGLVIDKRFLYITGIFLLILVFRHCYLNFSDSMYHLTFLKRIVKNDIFFNHSPFFGPEFYDIRYSYSFYVPLQAIFSVFSGLFSKNMIYSTENVFSYMHIFLYIISSLAVYEMQKKYFGKVTAFLTLILFSFLFTFVRSMEFSGYAFSISTYPSAFCIYFLFPVMLLSIRKKNISPWFFVFSGLLTAGTHIFYWGVFSLIQLFSNIFYKKPLNLLSFVAGGLPVLFLKFYYNTGIENIFFEKTAQISVYHNLIRWGGYITFPVTVIALSVAFFPSIRKRVPFLFYGLFFVTVLGLCAPFIAGIIPINSQKLLRVYQFSPGLFLMPVPLVFLFRRFRKTTLILLSALCIIGMISLFSVKEKNTLYTLSHDIKKMFSELPEKKKVLADPETSMLMCCFSYSYALCVYPEYAAPSVSDIYRRQTAWEVFLRNRENQFDADYALLPKSMQLQCPEGLLEDTGGMFWLLKIKQ